MNSRIGKIASVINLTAVAGFALCMLPGFDFGSYVSSIFIAMSFLVMMCGYAFYAPESRRVAGFAAAGFAAMYGAVNCVVYFTQVTTVRGGGLTVQAADILDFGRFGMFFNMDMLGYALMSAATFFAGLTVVPELKSEKWLKWLLIVHGVFFLSCFIAPMLGIFKPGGEEWIGVAALELWCAYFAPISALSCRYFSKRGK